MSDRFPFPRPYGWFAVGRVDELPDEPVTRLRYQDTDLVLWRDDAVADPADAWRLFDAYCPSEKPLTEFRRWAAQFYVSPAG